MSISFEMEYVGLLAKSVMCGTRPDCSIHFDANGDGMAPVRAAAIESGASEAEVMAQGMQLARAEAATPPRRVKRPRGMQEI